MRAIRPLGTLDADQCLTLAAALESRSEHPIARAFGRTITVADDVQSTPGLGLEGRWRTAACASARPTSCAP